MIKFILGTAVVACAQYGAQKATQELMTFAQNEIKAQQQRAAEKAARHRELLASYVRNNLEIHLPFIGVELQRHENGVVAAIKEANNLLAFYAGRGTDVSCESTITNEILANAKISDEFFELVGGKTGENLSVVTGVLIDFLIENKDKLEA